jgi:hypothetical protein
VESKNGEKRRAALCGVTWRTDGPIMLFDFLIQPVYTEGKETFNAELLRGEERKGKERSERWQENGKCYWKSVSMQN